MFSSSSESPELYDLPTYSPNTTDTNTATDFDKEKPYHSKRPHKKSRTGCKDCKIRKVKCDEARPRCRHCRLRKADCIYPKLSEPKEVAFLPVTSRPCSASAPFPEKCQDGWDLLQPAWAAVELDLDEEELALSTLPPSLPPSLPPISPVDTHDMRFLWFFTMFTSATFSSERGSDESFQNILRTRLVQHAFAAPFLMDTLLALSALHMQELNQQVDKGRLLMYRARSFEGYRKAVAERTPENYGAMIGSSLILTALSAQNFRDPEAKDLYILDWLIVWRGIGLLIKNMGTSNFVKSGLHALFYRPSMELETAATEAPEHLLMMIASIQPNDEDYPYAAAYLQALQCLGSLYRGLKRGFGPVMNLRVITWFTFLPQDFVKLARELRPRALILLAYYSSFLLLVKHIWWLAGVGERSLKDICSYISKNFDSEWQSYLTTPLAVLRLTDRGDIARELLGDPSWTEPQGAKAQALKAEDMQTVTNARAAPVILCDKAGKIFTVKGETFVPIEPNNNALFGNLFTLFKI